ncbi:MAG: transaldolase, partial [Nitrospinota bacterium]
IHSCAAAVPPATNPGVVLGAILGLAAQQGREKITLVTSPALRSFGAWLEQLLAESTGKEGKALIPVDQEQLTSPDRYGNDRLFVSLHLQGDTDEAQDRALAALEAAGHPVVRITLSDPYHLGQEMFRWEMATAVAGAIMGINPFDQPDVEATKTATRRLLSPDTPDRPSEAEPLWEEQGCRLFADPHNAAILSRAVEDNPSLARYLKAHLDRLTPGDYFALLAYIEMDDTCHRVLQAIRHAVRDAYRVATCLGYGPRYLHSTGQAHKGGPNNGLFLLITADDATDIPIPALPYTFGQVKAAQAQGDCQVLAERHRRLLRLHLSGDIVSRLKVLQQVITDAWEGTSK